MKNQIYRILEEIVKTLGVTDAEIVVDIPENPVHGDYTTNIAMILAKRLKAPPMKIGEQIIDQLTQYQKKSGSTLFEEVKLAPPGFINITVSGGGLGRALAEALEKKDRYGWTNYTSVTPDRSEQEGQKSSKKALSDQTGKKRGDFDQKKYPVLAKKFRTTPAGAEKKEKNGDMASFGKRKSVNAAEVSASRRIPAAGSHKTIMIEFAHPNTHKAFHIGHLRNITTGESIVRLLESQGNKVIRANYQGDVGMHIAKALYALLEVSPFKEEVHSVTGIKNRVEFLGKAYAAGSKAFEDPPAGGEKAKEIIIDLNALIYASAQRYAKEVGRNPGTTDYLALVKNHVHPVDTVYALWKETRQWSLDYFETVYERVYSHFDRLYFESECLAGADRAKDAVKKGILKESDGAIIFEGKPYGLDTRVFVNSLGLPTYEGKELALATMETTEFGPLDQLIHCVGPEQASFFKVTFKAEELLGTVKPGVQHHLIYGWVKLKQGKMSSRSGNVVLGEWLINEVKKEIKNILLKSKSNYKNDDQNEVPRQARDVEATAETIAIGAAKYSFLKVSTQSEIAFDLKESINTNGDSGPYLQYTYARCKSVLRKAIEQSTKSEIRNPCLAGRQAKQSQNSNNSNSKRLEFTDFEFVSNFDIRASNFNIEERLVSRRIAQFPDVVTDAAKNFAPNTLCTYLFHLAQEFNLFYAKHPILEKGRGDSVEGTVENQNDKKLNALPYTLNLRLALTAATAQVLKNGLWLLGINVLERM